MRAKAFTLVEMLLVMVLSTIVIAVAYMIFVQFKLFGSEYEKRSADSSEFLSFDQHLRHDIRAGSNIHGNHENFEILDENGKILAAYSLNAAGIRRTAHNLSDNFNIFIRNIWFESRTGSKTILFDIGPDSSQSDTFRYILNFPASAKTSFESAADETTER